MSSQKSTSLLQERAERPMALNSATFRCLPGMWHQGTGHVWCWSCSSFHNGDSSRGSAGQHATTGEAAEVAGANSEGGSSPVRLAGCFLFSKPAGELKQTQHGSKVCMFTAARGEKVLRQILCVCTLSAGQDPEFTTGPQQPPASWTQDHGCGLFCLGTS